MFEIDDYSRHAPTTKTVVDVNNQNEQQKRNDHNFSDALQSSDTPDAADCSPPMIGLKSPLIHSNGTWADTDTKFQIKKDYTGYSTIGQKMNELKSTLDTHVYEPEHMRSDTLSTTSS